MPKPKPKSKPKARPSKVGNGRGVNTTVAKRQRAPEAANDELKGMAK